MRRTAFRPLWIKSSSKRLSSKLCKSRGCYSTKSRSVGTTSEEKQRDVVEDLPISADEFRRMMGPFLPMLFKPDEVSKKVITPLTSYSGVPLPTISASFDELKEYVAEPVASGLSGGPDSTALALLLKRWYESFGVDYSFTTFTFDHSLRTESANEAKLVAKRAADLNIKNIILKANWEGDNTNGGDENKSKTKAYEDSRSKRFDQTLKACEDRKIKYFFLAHHLDDQIETFWMRMIQQSGIYGLSGIQTLSSHESSSVLLLRPLLGVPKSRLIATCNYFRQEYVTDPTNSNTDVSFRNRLRKVMPELVAHFNTTPFEVRSSSLTPSKKTAPQIDLSSEGPLEIFKTVIRGCQEMRDQIDREVEEFIQAHTRIIPKFGYMLIHRKSLLLQPVTIASRVLSYAISVVTGKNFRGLLNSEIYQLRALSRTRSRINVSAGNALICSGLNGFLLTNGLIICKNKRSVILPVPLPLNGEPIIWNNCWKVSVQGVENINNLDWRVTAMGEKEIRWLAKTSRIASIGNRTKEGARRRGSEFCRRRTTLWMWNPH